MPPGGGKGVSPLARLRASPLTADRRDEDKEGGQLFGPSELSNELMRRLLHSPRKTPATSSSLRTRATSSHGNAPYPVPRRVRTREGSSMWTSVYLTTIREHKAPVSLSMRRHRRFSPPHLQFLTKVYHCNIASTGAICELGFCGRMWTTC